jgi:4'-phosphopantetheinyl transferase
VHVWRVPITNDEESAYLDATESPLSQEERRRVEAFLAPPSRNVFVQARTALRVLLSIYLHREPADIQLATTHHGKPILAASPDAWLHFSVSHSGSFAVLAFAGRRPVGVDVERVRDDFDAAPIFERHFAPSEAAELRRLPVLLRSRAFFACWSRKEAVVKALGSGLSTPLSTFSVGVSPATPPAIILADGTACDVRRWAVCDLPVAPGYAAALAMPDPMLRVRHLDYACQRFWTQCRTSSPRRDDAREHDARQRFDEGLGRAASDRQGPRVRV